MSIEQVVAFWDSVERDEQLKESLASHLKGVGENAIQAISMFAKDKGYAVTAEEMETFLTERADDSHDEQLSDDALDQVTGGASRTTLQPSRSTMDFLKNTLKSDAFPAGK